MRGLFWGLSAFWLLSLFLLCRPAASPAATSSSPFMVYYFHGNMRCQTCNKIEKYTVEAVQAGFAEALASGALEIQVINTDQSEHEHFIKDFKLTNRSVILSKKGTADSPQRWKNLDRIWLLVRKQKTFQDYIVAELQAFMAAEQ